MDCVGRLGVGVSVHSAIMRLDSAEFQPNSPRFHPVTKGYTGEDFADAFERYLSYASPPHQSQSATPLQPNEISNLKEKSSATPDFFVADENEPNALKSNVCSGVADGDPAAQGEGDRSCAQCRGPVDGKERQVATGRKTVWLHPECERFHLKAETLPW